MRWSTALVLLLVAIACNDATLTSAPTAPTTEPGARDGGAASGDADAEPGADGGARDAAPTSTSNLRIVAANISSGPGSNYDPGEGIRLLAGLRPDVALLQELNYKTNTKADLDAFVSEAFGAGFDYYREDGVQIPNAVVSRYPILTSGRFVDPRVANRGFVYAKIDVPGPHDVWAVSVHFLTSSSGNRSAEATSLVEQLGGIVGDDDPVVVGGDFNTSTRTEPCLTTLGQIVDAAAPIPVDQDGNDSTNGVRNAPYDWVLTAPALAALQVPTVIGQNQFPTGLVFDSRVYTPLADVPPVQETDSAAQNMQHMPVVKDFALPEP